MENFVSIQRGEALAITEKMTKEGEVMAKKNTEVLVHLMDVLRTCVERGIALRGHRDDGVPSIDSEDYVNLGNFKAEVASHAKHDAVLREHLENAKVSSYATYLSKLPRLT